MELFEVGIHYVPTVEYPHEVGVSTLDLMKRYPLTLKLTDKPRIVKQKVLLPKK